jgi:SAM-dependent methyltransferase
MKSGVDPAAIVGRGYDDIACIYHEQRDKFKSSELLSGFASLLPGGANVLDVGCGAGVPVTRFLVDANFSVTGVDISSGMLQLARRHVPQANFVKMDMRQLGFAPGSLNGICAFYSLFHVPREDHPRVLTGFNRLLSQSGILLFCSGTGAWEGIEDFHGADMFWSHPDHETTRQMVLDAGFSLGMSEIRELGGEKHYWVMAEKNG